MSIIKGHSFDTLPPVGQLVCAPWGPPGSGKTHFACTFPGPVHIINMDLGLSGVVSKFQGQKEIYWYDFLITADPGGHTRMLRDMIETYQMILDILKDDGGTVVIDTVTQLWGLVQSVKLEEVKNTRAKKKNIDPSDVQIHAFDYAQANTWMGSCLRIIMGGQYPKVNGVFISRSGPEYAGNEATGRQVLAGFKELSSIVPLVVECFDKKGRKANGDCEGRLGKNRFNRDEEGELMPELSYEYLKGKYLTGASEYDRVGV